MNFDPLRRLQSALSAVALATAALVLSSCGGGGASSSPGSVGNLQLLPGTSSLYAGVPYTFNIVGGRAPYLVTSSEPTLVELGFTTSSNTFQVLPRNPGVVDVGLDPNEVPRRTVNIEVRDSNGAAISNAYNVLQNFFTGYQESYTSTCSAPSSGAAPQACSGTDSLINLFPISNGTLYGNRELQFTKVRGDFQFVVEDPNATPQLVDQIRRTTDHLGGIRQRLRVTNAAPTQLATYQITDIVSGASTMAVFLIVQQAPVDTITVVPSTLTFAGALNTQCGTGSSDVFVFGGTPPYTINAPAGISVSPTTLSSSGSKFTVTALSTSPPCQTGGSVVITDSKGAASAVDVTISAGSGTPPTLTASPTTVANLACGATAQVTLIGGAGGLSTTSSHPRIFATPSAGTLTITRQNGDGVTVYPTSGTITVTDGTTIVTVTITATPANCP